MVVERVAAVAIVPDAKAPRVVATAETVAADPVAAAAAAVESAETASR